MQKLTSVKSIVFLSTLMVALLPQSTAAVAQGPLDGMQPNTVHRLVSLKFKVVMDEPVAIRTAHDGDTFATHLLKDLRYNNVLIAPAGSRVLGHLFLVRDKEAGKKNAGNKKSNKAEHPQFALKFDQIEPTNQSEFNISGIANEQVSVVNTDGKLREIAFGPEGELLKTNSLEAIEISQLGLPLPVSFLKKKQIALVEGDEIAVRAIAHEDDIPSLSVSGKVLQSKRVDKESF